MAKSLFQKNSPEEKPAPPVNPYDKIEKEIGHLKKGTSVRHGGKAKTSWTPPWLVILAFCALAWIYLMDPIYHAWYKGEAARAYLYLHNYGSGPDAANLAATQFLSPDELDTLNRKTGSYQQYYKSPDAANKTAQTIIAYVTSVKLLHAGKYEQLDPLGRLRYALFIKTGIFLPTDWTFLDPAVSP